jgi:hypothetical protein
MFGQLMLISGHAPTSLNSQPPFTAKHNEQCRINSGEIVVVVSNKPVESEFLVLSSIGVGWVHLGHLIKT